MRPRFSVVIPTKDSADLISRTIVGVLSQTFAGLEVIVVDDASTDDTVDVVRMLADSRVRIIEHRPAHRDTDCTHNPGAARAAGFKRSTGRWATALDPGDEVDPAWLSRVGRLADHSGAAFVTCGGRQRFTDLSEVPISPIPVPEMDGVSACLRSGSFFAPATYFRSLSAPQLADMVTAGISIIDAVMADDLKLVSTPEQLLRWVDHVDSDVADSEQEKQLSRLMAALETLALAPIPDGNLLARYAALGGEVASQLGRRADARRLFAIARDTLPQVPQYWMEWAGSLLPFRIGTVED